jgi:hypothetical protein
LVSTSFRSVSISVFLCSCSISILQSAFQDMPRLLPDGHLSVRRQYLAEFRISHHCRLSWIRKLLSIFFIGVFQLSHHLVVFDFSFF